MSHDNMSKNEEIYLKFCRGLEFNSVMKRVAFENDRIYRFRDIAEIFLRRVVSGRLWWRAKSK